MDVRLTLWRVFVQGEPCSGEQGEGRASVAAFALLGQPRGIAELLNHSLDA